MIITDLSLSAANFEEYSHQVFNETAKAQLTIRKSLNNKTTPLKQIKRNARSFSMFSH